MDSGLPLPLFRWRRMAARMRDRREWHDHWSSPVGFAATILALLALFPIPMLQTVRAGSWQVESMMLQKVWPMAHLQKGLQLMNPSRLSECLWLRDRIGFHMAFLEDPMVGNMLLVRGFRGQKTAIHREAMRHQQELAEKELKAGKEEGEHSLSDWAERWIAYLEGGLGSACSASSPTCSSEGHCGVAEGEDSRTTGNCCGNHEAPRHQIKSIEGCYCHDVLVSESSTIFKAFKRASSFNRASSSSSPADRSAGRGSSTAACDPTTGSALPADVQPDDDVHSEPTSDSLRSTSRLDPQERPGTCSNGGRGCIRPDSPRDGLHQRRGSPTERRTHGRAGRGEHEGLRRSLSRPSSLNDFKLDVKGKMKDWHQADDLSSLGSTLS